MLAELRAKDEVGTRPEIDRSALRDLLRSLAHGTVVWGRSLRRITGDPEVRRRLDSECETIVANLVLGCDGGWSKVRPLITGVPPPAYRICEEGVSDLDEILKDRLKTPEERDRPAAALDRIQIAERPPREIAPELI